MILENTEACVSRSAGRRPHAPLVLEVRKSATISDCGLFRYRLRRAWAPEPCATLLYVMLNPSTADANVDDATIRRCIRFAQDLGFGAMEVVNLFAFRATKPADLKLAGYPVGPANDLHIAEAVAASAAVCLAWGANVAGLERPQIVLPMLRGLGLKLMCLRITRSGYPQHPLMLPTSCRLMPFTIEAIDDAMHGDTGGAGEGTRG